MYNAKYHVVVMGQPNGFLAKYLMKNKYEWRVSPKAAYAVDADRNQAIMHFLENEVPKGGYTHFIMFDHDMIPRESMGELFKPHDLAYLGYVGTSGVLGHNGDNDFGASSFCASADALALIPRPWFKVKFDNDRCQKLDCECNHFLRQATSVGLSSKCVGTMGHQQGGGGGAILVPHKEKGYDIVWPYELNV